MLFLCKLNNNDRDCCKYIEFAGFECGHYFGGIRISGACFCGFEKELRDEVENNFENIETILTKEEFKKLFSLHDDIKALGYGIEKDSEKYEEGLKIIQEYQNTIREKLLSEENEKLFEKVVKDEKEYIKNEYNLTDDEVEYIFDHYNGDYKDRAIVGYIYDDADEFVAEEKWSLGYDKQPYFDDDAFLKDLLADDYYYLELESGKIVSYSY